jgi:predicted nucleic acid-binding protein
MTKQASGYVFDTGALALHFAGGSQGEKVKSYFDQVLSGKKEGYISEVTMAEYFYKTCQKLGIDVASIRAKSIRQSRIKVTAVDETISTIAGELKCRHADKISIADAFAAATAKTKKSELLTTDGALTTLEEIKAKHILI